MKLGSLYPAIAISILLLNFVIAVVSGEEDRHTPGFPQVTESSSTQLPIPINISDIEKAVSELYNRNLLSREEFEKLKNLNNLSLKEALSRISNDDVRNQLLNLYNKNMITSEDVEAFLNYLDTLKTSGVLDPIDELLALKALEILSNTIQNPYTSEIILRMFSVLKDLEVMRKGISIPEKFTPSSLASTGKPSPTLPQLFTPLLQLPTLPRLRFSLPNIPREVSVSIYIAFSIAIALIVGRKYLVSALNKLRIGLATGRTIQWINDVFLEAYWRSVYIVSTITGLRRYDWETHREFLEKVSNVLDSRVAEIFKDITYAYEEYRYGFKSSSGQRILGSFKKLVNYVKSYT
ncbi:MAG: DUF4129 domain-containing protein [Desulfurococcaceae archaeon]|nr:DUF4129 domain-containing protein [Desulfurococcaceae archaeon]